MKKLVLILAMVMIAVGSNAQTIIAEKDWSEMPVGWYEGCWGEIDPPIVIEEGYLINSNPFPNANYWEPQVAILAQIDKLEAGGQYQVKLTAEFPCDGELRLDLCSWDGSGATKAVVIDVKKGLQEYTIDFLDYPTSCTDAMLFYQCGHLPGRNVVVKVQVIEKTKGGTTAVRSLESAKSGDNAIYNLAGQRVDASYKGIVIKNGRKVVQK